MYKTQGEAILNVGVIVGNPFLTNEGSLVPSPRGGYLSCESHSRKSVPDYEGSFVQSPRGGYLISGVFGSRLKRIEYRKVGHYVPKGFLTMYL